MNMNEFEFSVICDYLIGGDAGNITAIVEAPNAVAASLIFLDAIQDQLPGIATNVVLRVTLVIGESATDSRNT